MSLEINISFLIPKRYNEVIQVSEQYIRQLIAQANSQWIMNFPTRNITAT